MGGGSHNMLGQPVFWSEGVVFAFAACPLLPDYSSKSRFPHEGGPFIRPSLQSVGAEDEERHGPRRGEQVVLPWPS